MTAVWVSTWLLAIAAVAWVTVAQVRRYPKWVRVSEARQPYDLLFAAKVAASIVSGIGAVALAFRYGPWMATVVWAMSLLAARAIPELIHNHRARALRPGR